ncbi:hypothetical protein [Niabella hibiscisoli]|uniref:hypothetical protein n=1 Tax=Niabella hibiscisoli TaxID=1825928 RepID=UPI001F106366|nr:hypothetical protein [Niabella hibiscisoli]MCH5720899.1 hypothetical protein [Niabella hibiscisoli]
MIIRYILTICLLIAILPLAAQKTVKGRVNDFTYDTISPLPKATVTNISRGSSVSADNSGYYSINANENDSLIFSFSGFISDTVKVQEQFFISGYDAALIERAAFLAGVTVMADYRRDSIRRRQEYAYAYEKPLGITGGHTPSAGAGIVLSPSAIFSKERKANKRLKTRLLKQEEDAYVDYVFSPAWVSSLTGLKDEALKSFMNEYRPSYEFCRQRNKGELITYVSDKFKEFQAKNRK